MKERSNVELLEARISQGAVFGKERKGFTEAKRRTKEAVCWARVIVLQMCWRRTVGPVDLDEVAVCKEKCSGPSGRILGRRRLGASRRGASGALNLSPRLIEARQ